MGTPDDNPEGPEEVDPEPVKRRAGYSPLLVTRRFAWFLAVSLLAGSVVAGFWMTSDLSRGTAWATVICGVIVGIAAGICMIVAQARGVFDGPRSTTFKLSFGAVAGLSGLIIIVSHTLPAVAAGVVTAGGVWFATIAAGGALLAPDP